MKPQLAKAPAARETEPKREPARQADPIAPEILHLTDSFTSTAAAALVDTNDEPTHISQHLESFIDAITQSGITKEVLIYIAEISDISPTSRVTASRIMNHLEQSDLEIIPNMEKLQSILTGIAPDLPDYSLELDGPDDNGGYRLDILPEDEL
ncbi:hypothetical protein HYW82_04550 [Candidatus Peregrinibacteria bacterium]|nr:hypothetical protein [Candidatus Peregrinibacteria bacterium]